MKRIKRFFLPLLIFSIIGLSSQPVMAQGWVKASKVVSKQAAKAIKGSSSKSTKLIQPTKKAATRTGNVSNSAAVAAQYTTVKCGACSGKGWCMYNGYRYKCNACSGYGYKVIRR